MKKWKKWVGSCFYLGFSRWAPGTLGSFFGLVIFGLISLLHLPVLIYLTMVAFLLWIGISCSNEFINHTGQKDPQQVVFDEAVGILMTLAGVPVHMKSIAAGFILFRIFDIWKPFPIRQIETLPGGLGVMLDDILAGIYANVFLRMFLHFNSI